MRCRPLLRAFVALSALGCGGKEFTGDGGGGGTTGGSGPTGGMGGGAGMPTGGSGGSGGSVPTGGTAGTPGCNCLPTQYCRGGECLDCGELSTLDFGDPELLLDDPSASLRFPRSGDTPSSLFYRAGNENAGQIFYTPSASALGAFVGNPSVAQQSGALYVAELDPRFNLIFDQSSDTVRNARAGLWNGSAIGSEMLMPPPLSPSGFKDYSVAATTSTRRLYWMSNRDGEFLRTGVLGSGDGTIVGIDVPKRTGTGNCERAGSDATPWVTPDGRRMFLRAPPFDDACEPLGAGETDLFVVPLVPESGMPSQPALALASLNAVGSTETDPSLSPDFCEIYFASDRDSAGTSDFKLYRARRR
jgi:hypothetical protein